MRRQGGVHLYARSEHAVSTRPNHQPLLRPRGPHIEQPRLLALVFALGGHAPSAHQSHHRELQPFADVQRHYLDAVVRGVVHAGRVAAHLVRQLSFAQEFDTYVHFAVVAAEDGHVGPGVAFALGWGDLASDGMAEPARKSLI